MNAAGYANYKNKTIDTMTPGELLLLLLDELVKRAMRADIALEDQNYEQFEAAMDRCFDIVRYLDDTLDRRYVIGLQLHRLYDFFCFDISRIKFGRNKAELDRLKPMFIELRDAFREAERITSQGGGGDAGDFGGA